MKETPLTKALAERLGYDEDLVKLCNFGDLRDIYDALGAYDSLVSFESPPGLVGKYVNWYRGIALEELGDVEREQELSAQQEYIAGRIRYIAQMEGAKERYENCMTKLGERDDVVMDNLRSSIMAVSEGPEQTALYRAIKETYPLKNALYALNRFNSGDEKAALELFAKGVSKGEEMSFLVGLMVIDQACARNPKRELDLNKNVLDLVKRAEAAGMDVSALMKEKIYMVGLLSVQPDGGLYELDRRLMAAERGKRVYANREKSWDDKVKVVHVTHDSWEER